MEELLPILKPFKPLLDAAGINTTAFAAVTGFTLYLTDCFKIRFGAKGGKVQWLAIGLALLTSLALIVPWNTKPTGWALMQALVNAALAAALSIIAAAGRSIIKDRMAAKAAASPADSEAPDAEPR